MMVMPVGYYSEVKLTGRQRVRRGWFGKLILQVEVEQVYLHPLGTAWQRSRPGCGELRTKWRDAVADDVGLETALVKGITHVP